jgi:hypothetical protein
MNWLLNLVPLPYRIWLELSVYVLVAAGAAWAMHWIDASVDARAAVVEQKAELKQEKAQEVVTDVVAARVVKKQAATAQVFSEREKEIANHDNQPDATPVQLAAANLRVPLRTVCLWNSANQGVLPPAGCLDDAGPSGATVREVERQHDREASLFKIVESDLAALQHWVCEQATLKNGERPPFDVCSLTLDPRLDVPPEKPRQ